MKILKKYIKFIKNIFKKISKMGQFDDNIKNI